MEYVIIGFLGSFLVFTEIRNYFERKNLIDRLMARDFSDLVDGEARRKKQPEVEHEDHLQAL